MNVKMCDVNDDFVLAIESDGVAGLLLFFSFMQIWLVLSVSVHVNGFRVLSVCCRFFFLSLFLFVRIPHFFNDITKFHIHITVHFQRCRNH